MFQSHVIEVTGVFAGVAVTVPGRLHFVAVDPRLADLDATEWPSLADVRRVVAAVMTRNGHFPAVPV
jgi:hypothetical protein